MVSLAALMVTCAVFKMVVAPLLSVATAVTVWVPIVEAALAMAPSLYAAVATKGCYRLGYNLRHCLVSTR